MRYMSCSRLETCLQLCQQAEMRHSKKRSEAYGQAGSLTCIRFAVTVRVISVKKREKQERALTFPVS